MGTQIAVPSPQHRYLEPYKNRVFQYDTKHSNLFLSHYTNQILNAVGDDSIVRGLEVSPKVNSSKTGIDFTVSPGALVQDLTYFEFQNDTTVSMEEIVDFSDFYVVIYTSYRYIETVYENPMKLEATLYNPRTKRALSVWNPVTNRIILGVYSFTVENGIITGVIEEDSTIFFEEANVIRNGSFDFFTTECWTPINSLVNIVREGGAMDSPYIEATPVSNNYQGIAQAFSTKPNITYEVSFYVKSEESVPFQALLLDRDSVYNINAPQIKSYESTSTKRWTLHTFRFTAFSSMTTLFLLKRSASLDNKIDFDHICIFEYTPTRRRCELHNIAIIDGGRIPTTENLIPVVNPETSVCRWSIRCISGASRYDIDSTQPHLKNPRRGIYIVFFGGRYANEEEYLIDWKNNRIYINTTLDNTIDSIFIYFLMNPKTSEYEWNIPLKSGLNIYSPSNTQEDFQNPLEGKYFVFYNGSKLSETYYEIDFSGNTVRFDSTKVNQSIAKNVYISFVSDPVVVKEWSFKTTARVNAYYLSSSQEEFLSEDNGKYLVFIGNQKLSEDNYMIKPAEGVITLSSAATPSTSNVLLQIYYFGNKEPVDLTPVDNDCGIYKWSFNVRSDQTVYYLDSSQDPFRNVNRGTYLAFRNGTPIQQNDLMVNISARKITFSSTILQNNAVIDLYYIKKAYEAKYFWEFQASSANQRSYSPAAGKPVLQSPDDGTYLVILGSKQLNKSQYTVAYATNTLQIASSVSVPKNTKIQVLFITEPVVSKFWEFTTVAHVGSYLPKANESSFIDLPDGEFILFKDGIKLSSDEYKVNQLKNNVTFSTVPQSGGSKCELYFVGRE